MTQSLDYSLKTQEERVECVKKVIESTPKDKLTKKYLDYMNDYILFINEKGRTKGHNLLTKNREATIHKREVSYEGMITSLEGGEDTLHALINNDKTQLLDRKDKVTQQEIADNPLLQEQMKIINQLKDQFDQETNPQKRSSLKQQIIETWQQIYIIKSSGKASISTRMPAQMKTIAHMPIEEKITVNKDGSLNIHSPLSLLRPEHVSFLLNYYSALKQDTEEELDNDMHWLLIDLENLVEDVLSAPDYSAVRNEVLYDLLVWKVDGRTGKEIQELMEIHHGEVHSEQYYSTLWRKHLPKLLAKEAQKKWLVWHYSNENYGQWKKCSKCGEWKIVSPLFFDRSPVSKDGYYPQCKECRSTRKK